MKGITPVVAVILLLLITIAVIGFAFGYFSTIMQTTGEAAQEQAEATTDRLSKSVLIDSVADTNLYIRNVGTKNINVTSEISVYKDGTSEACSFANQAYLTPNEVRVCTLADCTGSRIKVVAPAGPVEANC